MMMEPRDVLRAALADVEAEQPADELRVKAFEKVFDLHAGAVAGASPAVAQPSTGTTPREDFNSPGTNRGGAAPASVTASRAIRESSYP
jgi:hypothetical protein